MPLNLNTVTVAGNLTRSPESRNVGQSVVCNFDIAINRKYKADGELKEDTTFLQVEVWGRQAELCQQYLDKGSNCVVEGSLKQDTWTSKEGKKQSKVKVFGHRVHFVGGQQSGAGFKKSGPHLSGSASNNMADDYDGEDLPF